MKRLAWAKKHRRLLFLATGHRFCFHCGTAPGTTLDHILPYSKGGRLILVLSCYKCNHVRQTKAIPDYKIPLAKSITLKAVELNIGEAIRFEGNSWRAKKLLNQWAQEWETYHSIYGDQNVPSH